jgi:uncharacterized protein YcnI
MKRRFALSALVALGALSITATAWAHAEVSPPVALAGAGQVFTLAVPTEKEAATTTKVELTTPDGFDVDSFIAAPGWTRTAAKNTVTWRGGVVPTGEVAAFSFLASTKSSGTYTFQVRQTYSDGTIVDWSGPDSSDTPAPVVQAVSSFGGSGGSSTLTIVALVLAGIALVLATVGLLARGGRELA